jgi:phosphoglycerol transferase MdoB-like AlkP superfamily enzyme
MQRVKIVLKLWLLLLAVYFLLRVCFAFTYFNPAHFSFSEIFSLFYWGLRLDFAALFYINILFFGFYFVLVPFFNPPWRVMLSATVFSLINLPFIALNFIDLVYFRYNLRRSTVDIFYALGDSVHSFGALFRQYWFVLLSFIIVSILFIKIVMKIFGEEKTIKQEKWYTKWLVPLAFIGTCLLVARGWESRPIAPSTALLHADASLQPLVNNSTLNLLYSKLRSTTRLDRKNYFTTSQLDSIYTIRRHYAHDSGFQKKNVVLFVLESLSADFFAAGPHRARTPFFDSLMQQSTICTNAFANGSESVKGMTAILGSIPPFTDEPLFISNYSSVPFNGIGTLLKQEGYSTLFFHGAEYDHFNFAKLCRMVGIDQYYSKDTYHHPEQDDGSWGIYDEYFFPYFAAIVSTQKQPFFSVLFNTSSHPPFAIPAARKNRFTIQGQSAQLNAVSYVDDCFRALFEKIKTQPWFHNSVFVFVADHTLIENIDRKSYLYKAFHIPFFIYDPQHPGQVMIDEPVQQLDVVPTILDRLNYSKPFMSFGNRIRANDTTDRRFAIHRVYNAYQLIDTAGIAGYEDQSGNTLYYYDRRADSALARNLYPPETPVIRQNIDLIKAILQRFHNSLLDQQLLIKE